MAVNDNPIPPPDDDRHNYSFYSSSDTSITVSTMPGASSGSGYLTTGTCYTCGQDPCTCSTKPSWSSVTVSTSPNWPSLDEAADFLEKLRVCVVCGAEDCVVLCEVCVEAVKLARNRWLDDFRREIESLDRN